MTVANIIAELEDIIADFQKIGNKSSEIQLIEDRMAYLKYKIYSDLAEKESEMGCFGI